jgi:hypothetical protein
MKGQILRNLILDAVIDGQINGTAYPHGIHLNATVLNSLFLSKDHSKKYLASFLSNSEMDTKTDYVKFVVRNGKGKYLIHPLELAFRMRERGVI